MTYPPQPGQPDPYGQQPPSGGFPQQPQPGWDPNAAGQQPAWDPNAQQPQQPAWDPNAQQQQQPAWDPNAQQQYPGTQQYPTGWDPNAQQQQPQYGQPGQYPGQQQAWDPNQPGQQQGWDPNQPGQGGGYGQPAPKGNKTGLWIAIGVVVVLVAALGITGFVAPGFFLSKDSDNNTASGPSSSASQPAVPPAQTSQQPTDEPSPSEQPPGTGSSGDGGEGQTFFQGFVDKLNSGDVDGALAMSCPDNKDTNTTWLKTITKGPYALKLGEVNTFSTTSTGESSGTANGKSVTGIMLASKESGNWCMTSILLS